MFIFKYSEIAAPLFNLLKKDVKFEWDFKCEKAFTELKDRLVEAPILVYPDLNKAFILSTDASDSSVGFVLGQLDDQNHERVVAYGGRALRGNELKFSIHEKECLALITAIKQFHPYLANSKFTVYTDNLEMKYIQGLKDLNGRKGRWAMKLQSYDFEIVFKPGSKNGNADALSRRPYDSQLESSKGDKNDIKDINVCESERLQVEFEYKENDCSDVPLITAMNVADDKDDDFDDDDITVSHMSDNSHLAKDKGIVLN